MEKGTILKIENCIEHFDWFTGWILIAAFLIVFLSFMVSPASAEPIINPSVEDQPFFCQSDLTKWICDITKPGPKGNTGTQGPAGQNNFSAIYYNSSNFNSTSNNATFFNSTNITSNSNYTIFQGTQVNWYNGTINESYAYLPGRVGGQVLVGGVNNLDGISIYANTAALQGIVDLQPYNGLTRIGGNLSITNGINAANTKFNIRGSGSAGVIESGSDFYFDIDDDNTETATGIYFRKNNVGTILAVIGENGLTGFGGISAPTGAIDFTGQFRDRSCSGTPTFSADGNMTCSSDEKLKDKIIPFTSSISIIKNINPITWDWKSTSGYLGTSTGFSAQNVIEAGLPSAVIARTDYKYVQEVTKSKDGGEDKAETKAVDLGTKTLSIDQTVILATAINAIKEQQITIEAQQKTIDEMKSRMDKAGI